MLDVTLWFNSNAGGGIVKGAFLFFLFLGVARRQGREPSHIFLRREACGAVIGISAFCSFYS